MPVSTRRRISLVPQAPVDLWAGGRYSSPVPPLPNFVFTLAATGTTLSISMFSSAEYSVWRAVWNSLVGLNTAFALSAAPALCRANRTWSSPINSSAAASGICYTPELLRAKGFQQTVWGTCPVSAVDAAGIEVFEWGCHRWLSIAVEADSDADQAAKGSPEEQFDFNCVFSYLVRVCPVCAR